MLSKPDIRPRGKTSRWWGGERAVSRTRKTVPRICNCIERGKHHGRSLQGVFRGSVLLRVVTFPFNQTENDFAA